MTGLFKDTPGNTSRAAIGKGGARKIFSDVLKAGMGGAMNSETQFFNAVWRRAAKLSKLRREGKLGDDLTEELERQLGIDSQAVHDREAAKEADAIANEALYAGGQSYSEEHPGPNGETFSLVPLGPHVRMIRQSDVPAIVDPAFLDPFATVQDDGTLGVWNKAWKAWEKQNRDQWRGTVQTPEGDIQISGKTDEEMRKLAKGEDAHLHYEAAAQLPALLKNSALAAVEPDYKNKPDVAETHRRYAWMRFADGKVRSVLLTVFRWKADTKRDFDTAYSEEVLLEVQPQPVLVPPASENQAGGDTGVAANKATAFISGIKPEHRWQGATFSIRPGDFSSRMAAAFSPFQRSPELRLAIAHVAKQRAMRLGAEWLDKAAVLRSARDIGREQRFREADGYEQRTQAYLNSLTPAARQELEFEPFALKDDPLISMMLDFGKLMSFTTAKKLGKVEAKSGDYDGVPWLPREWYSKGGGVMPDVMASYLHEEGLLPDGYIDTLWEKVPVLRSPHQWYPR